MKEETLKRVIYYACEFVMRAKELEKVMPSKPRWSWGGCRESAAVRRASMDLTHVLADLRQNR